MNVNMDPMENDTNDNNSEEQHSQSEGAESSVRPSLSQVKKSWGFRRTTIAKREFLEEVGELTHSPPLVRRGKSRRTTQTPRATPDIHTTQRASRATKSVLDDLEWSTPSSPASEESKSASEASAGGSLDPSLWQDFGSAFHTAFSLLGGNEGLPMEMSNTLTAPDILEATDTNDAPPLQAVDETEVPDGMESANDEEISQPVAPDDVPGGEINDVVLISSQEEDSDEMTLIQIKQQMASKGRQGETRARGGKGGRGKAKGRGRGRGRGRGKGRGRGRGRGRAAPLQSNTGDDEDSDDDVVLVTPVDQRLQQLREEEKANKSHSPAEIEISPGHSDVSLSPAQQSSSDCAIIDTDLDQTGDVTPGQYDDAPEEEDEEEEEEEKKKGHKNIREFSGILDSEAYDSNVLYCICRQKHNKRFMICCDGCQEWFHGNCVGISETQGRMMERNGQEYICPSCTAKKQSQLQPEPHCQPEPELSFPKCLTLNPSSEEGEGREERQALKETVVEEGAEKEQENAEATVIKLEPEPKATMETSGALPLCIGPGCSKQALPDSVYCGTDCILQHAAVTMKTLSEPKVPKARGRAQRKPAATRPLAKGQRSGRMSKRLAEKAEEGGEEEMKEDDGGQKEAASPLACDPSLTEVIPSPKFYTASEKDSEQVEADSEAVKESKQSPEDTSTDAAPSSQPASEQAPLRSSSEEPKMEPISRGVSKEQSVESSPSISPNPTTSTLSPSAQSPSTSALRHHETGALMVSKTAYVIPKKQSGPQPPSSHISTPASYQKPSAAPTLLNETRNLPVPPAPSAPSSRPSQPNTQIRQSIQRSLTSILFKRVCDCEDLEMSESEVAKLVGSIEMEMFDIFRNTDSKYMNKYRTIMFNLKDPRNKGLLYRVVRGEIGPFRLVRMSQKDMQATKASEPNPKEATEFKVKDTFAKATDLLQKPEAVRVDLASLTSAGPDRGMEQKKSLPAPGFKIRTSQPSPSSAVPDILACMLKDTTSEHKTHLFDLKCKICTGQIIPGDEEEPAKKKPKVSEKRNKYESSWRKSGGDDSPLRAPPDSPDLDSPTSSPMDHSSRLVIDSPTLTIVESPASPIRDSPASPTLDSPASPVMESPASPTSDSKASTVRAYTPVVIPAVSTVTITRRDPRTAANRFSVSSSGTSTLSNTNVNQSATYTPLQETRSASPPAPASLRPTKAVPKSILMKPSPSADPRLYGITSRTVTSESPADDETAKFLAKQDIMWKGFLNMLSVAKFVTKGYLVSGSAENLKADLPDTIQIGGRIMPQTVWDYVAKLKTSVTKELCVMRFHPATEEEEVAYVSLFSYFSSRGRFGVVANNSRSIKDVYLVPLSANESIPSILQPLDGPGLAIIQKTKRPGSLPQEIEEKRPKVHMSKDPMWIPKPPVLYGSDKLEIFQPYDPETPSSTTPPGSPSCLGSPSESSSSGSVSVPSLSTSIKANPSASTSAAVAATQSTCNSPSDNPTTESSNKTPLQAILKTLFGKKQTDSMDSSDGSSTKTTADGIKKLPQVSGSMVDPIVQQYGKKSKVKQIEEDENDFDRPYDPEEEYDPAMGYGVAAPQSMEKNKADSPAVPRFVDDDVAYDPEDETIFADIQSDIVAKPPVPTQAPSDSPSCPTPVSTQSVTSASTTPPEQTCNSAGITQNLPTGIVVVSAATLSEQQRMLEELNKQIEEQKRQLKEQEEALRQQREAVGMFMAHFSVSDSLMSPPQKSLPLSQVSSLQSGIMQTESRSSESTDKISNLTETVDSLNVDSQIVKTEETTVIPNDTEQDETQENVKESDKYSSAGEIEDSDVAYDPEDESLFNEIQDDVFQGGSTKTHDSSRIGHSGSRKGSSLNSYHSRKRRLSPKKRSHRERDRHRSPSRRSQHRSPSHSRRRREKDRHRRSERERSKHRARDQSERQGRHHKDHTTSRHSRGHRKSPSSPRKKDSVALSPKQYTGPSPQVTEKSKHVSVLCNTQDLSDSVVGQFVESNTLSCTPITIEKDPDGYQLKCNLHESPGKAFSPSSFDPLHNVKHEISEPSKSEQLQKNSVSDHDNASGPSVQADKSFQLDTLLMSKIESTIPLREIDPPIRDSPQSPDPEPQFMKPSNIEQSQCVKIEEIGDPDTCTGVSVPHIKAENNNLPITSQETISNILWPTVGNKKNTNLDFGAPDLKKSPVSDQGMIEEYKQRERESPCLNHPEILSQVEGQSDQALGSDIHGSGPELNPATKLGPGMSGTGIRIPGPDMKEPGYRGPTLYPREMVMRFPGPGMRDTAMQGISPNVWGPISHVQDLAISGEGKHGIEPGGEQNMGRVIQNYNTNRIGTGPGMQGSRMKSPVQHVEGSSVQSVNAEVKGLGPDIKHNEAEMREEVHVPAVTNLHMRGSGLQNERRDLVMNCPSDRLGRDISGLGSREPVGAVCHPSEDTRGPIPSLRGSEIVQRQQRHGGSLVLEEMCPWKRGFPPQGRDVDFGGQPTSSVDIVRKLDRLSPAMTDAMCGSQRGREVHMRGPGPNIQYGHGGSNMSCIGQDSSGPERSEDMGRMGGLDTVDERSESHARRSGRDFGEPCPNKRDADMQGTNIQAHWLEMRNEHMGQEDKGPFPNIINQDCGGPGPDLKGQRTHTKGPGPHMRNPDCSGPGSDIRGDWVGPDRRRSGPVSGGPFIQDEWTVSLPERRGPNIENQGPDRRGTGGLDFRESGSEMRNFGNGRGLACPDFIAPGPVKRGPDVEVQGHDRREPGGLDLIRPGPERRGSDMGIPMYDRRGPGGPDFRRPGPERRGPTDDNLGPGMRGPGGPNFMGPGLDRRGLAMEGPGPNRRGSAGPDLREPFTERTGPGIIVSDPDRRGPGDQDIWGPGPERRGPGMEGPGPNRRGPGGPDFRKPGPERRGPGPDRGGPGGPDFRGPGPESRNLSMEGPGPEMRGPGGPDFRGPGHDRIGFSMGHPGPDTRESGGLDFRGPGLEWRGPDMQSPRPDRRNPEGSNFSGPGPEMRGPPMGVPGPNRKDFIGPGHGRGHHTMDSQEPQRGGPRCPDFRGPGPERRGPAMEAIGPDIRGTRDTDFSGPGPERRGSAVDSQECDSRGGFQGPGPEMRGLVMDGPGPDSRVPCGPDFKGSGCERRGPSMQGHIPDRRGPGENAGLLGLERRGPYMRGPGPDFIRLGPERTGPGMEGPGPHGRGQGAPHFREGGHPSMEETGPDRRGQDIRGPRPERPGPGPNRRGRGGPNMRRPGLQPNTGPGSDRRGQRGTDIRGPSCESRSPGIEGPGLDWTRSGGPGFRGPGIRQKGPSTENLRHQDDWGGNDFEGSEPIQESPDLVGPRPARTGQNLSCQGNMRRNIRGPGPDFRGSTPDRRGSDTVDHWSDGREPNVEVVSNERECSGPVWKRHGNRGPGPIQEGPDEQVQEHTRQGPCTEWRDPGIRRPRPTQERLNMPFPGDSRGPRDDWGGPGYRGPGSVQDHPDMAYQGPSIGGPGNQWRETDKGGAGTNRWGPGPFFREERDLDNKEQSHDGRGPSMIGSDMTGGPDDWGQADYRGNRRGPNMEYGPGAHRGGPDSIHSFPNRKGFEMEGNDRRGLRDPDLRSSWSENRNSNVEGPGTDGRFSDYEGMRDEWQCLDMESSETGRQGFEHDFMRERRGPDMRGTATESPYNWHEPRQWDTNTEGPGRNRRHLRGSEPPSFQFSRPNQIPRFQGPSDSPPAPYSGPRGPTQNIGGNSCPGFDNLQNQQAGKPQRHRAALLPTPTEGLLRFPNHMINNPDVFNPKRKPMGHPADREWSRGRPASQERELGKGQTQEQVKSTASQISTPVDASTGGGEEKKEESTDKSGIHGVSVETKTDQSINNVMPSETG